MAHHQAYNNMGYNQRTPMTGMTPMAMNTGYNSMASVNPSMMSSMNVNSMNNMNNSMNHMMMSGNGVNMSGGNIANGMSPMNNMNNVGMMNSAMTTNAVPMKMTLQVRRV